MGWNEDAQPEQNRLVVIMCGNDHAANPLCYILGLRLIMLF